MQLTPKNLQTPKWDWMIPVAMLTASTAAFIGSVSFAVFSVETWTAKRNADLVKIGVNALRVDPDTAKQISAARDWALNLIDVIAGGVEFSPEARAQRLREPLKYETGWYHIGSRYTPVKPAPRRPSPEPPN